MKYDSDAQHHYSLYETAVCMNSEVRRHVFSEVTELQLRRKVAS